MEVHGRDGAALRSLLPAPSQCRSRNVVFAKRKRWPKPDAAAGNEPDATLLLHSAGPTPQAVRLVTSPELELELELIQSHMAQKSVLRGEVEQAPWWPHREER